MTRISWAKHTSSRVAKKDGYAIVEVIWNDAQAVATEQWEEGFDGEPATTCTVGYLVGETKTTVTLMSMINMNHIGHGITIPRGCIVGSVRQLVLA